nr:MAG TPA_asm: hypothetical protein [Caudoviricetes sp.]
MVYSVFIYIYSIPHVFLKSSQNHCTHNLRMA